ncbi:c-type cytochrome biogenesis protein CcsB [Motilibacter rhizosphaerae]|nr:c-type cytochrome biogenesis protein CcsB [Motilibacter rhizosphaerae]
MAALSLDLVYSAMAVYTLAMVCFFAEIALGRSAVAVPAVAPVEERVPAMAGGPGVAPEPVAVVPDAASSGGRGERLGRTAVALTTLAFLLHGAGLVTRGLAAHRAPWGNMYEFALTATFMAAGVLLAGLRAWGVRAAGAVVVPVVLLLLGLGVTVLYTDAEQLVPALQSYWLWIHVTAATLAAGGFMLGAALTSLRLARGRLEVRAPRWTSALPADDVLDRTAYRAHVFAFPVFTFAVMAGAIWAENAWGRYWGWDPKETWSFITWVFYAGYLHARATPGWRRRADLLALLGFAALMFNLFGVNIWFSGLHEYAGLGK